MSDIHPLSGSSYPEYSQSNPLDVNNHPDTILPDPGMGNGTRQPSDFADAVGEYRLGGAARRQNDFQRALKNLK